MPAIETIEYVVTLLWRISWQASWLVLLVLLAQGLMRHRLSPSWRSALWLLVMVRLLLPVTPSSGWSLFNLTGGWVAPATMAAKGMAWGDARDWRELAAVEAAGLEVEPWWSAAMEERVEQAGDAWVVQRGTVPSSEGAVESVGAGRAAAQPFPWMAILFWLWLAGVLVLGVRVAGSVVIFTRRVRKEPVVTDPEVLAMFAECRRDMGTRIPVTLVETNEVDSPALFGFWRLNLLLPPQTIQRLSGAELRHVFLHELAHVRRGDVTLNWLATLIQILHWFNPVIWFALARMCGDREIACDALALERGGLVDRTAYGATILRLVSGLGSARPAPGLVGISEGKSNLKRRIRMIAMNRQPRRRPWLAGMILVVLGLVSLTDARTVRGVEESDSVAGEVGSDAQEPMVPETNADGLLEVETDAPEAESAVGETDDSIRRNEAANRVEQGKSLYELGRFAEAEFELRQALELDPENPAPHNYLKLVSEAKYTLESSAERRGGGDEDGNVISQRLPDQEATLETRIIRVDPARMSEELRAIQGEEIDEDEPKVNSQVAMREFIGGLGVNTLPPNQIYYNERKGVLMVRATPQELELILQAIGGRVTIPGGRRSNQQDLEMAPLRDASDTESSTYQGGQAIRSKLHQIILDELRFENVALPQVLKYLQEVTLALDPDRLGINYLISPHVLVPDATAPLVDPTTGRVIPARPLDPLDMDEVMIRIVPPLRKVRLSDVLEAIVRVSSHPIRYSIEESAVVFSPGSPNTSPGLETRIFRVNPNTFIDGLRGVGTLPTLDYGPIARANLGDGGLREGILPGVTSTNLTQDSQETVRQFFLAAGVNVMPPNQIYYQHRKGVLMVRATPEELDIIQQAVEVLHEPPPMITLELRLIEISQDAASDAESGRSRDSVDQKIPTGILTERQLEAMLRQLEDRPGVRVVSGPRVTTLSGRETRLSQSLSDGVIVDLDCLPMVKSDGYTIVTRLVIGGKGAKGPETIQTADSETVGGRPEFSTMHTVLDSQTVVLGGLFADDFQPLKDESPALKDLPVIGELFSNDPADTRRHLVLLVTPTIIDPAGNRVHPPDRRTFDANRIPVQAILVGPRETLDRK